MEALFSFLNDKLKNLSLETYKTLNFNFTNFSSLEDLKKVVPSNITPFFSHFLSTSNEEEFQSIDELTNYLANTGLEFTDLNNLTLNLTFKKSQICNEENTFFFTNFNALLEEINLNLDDFSSVFNLDNFIQNMQKLNIILLKELEIPLENEFMRLSNFNDIKSNIPIDNELNFKLQSYNNTFEKINFKYIYQIPEFYYFKNSYIPLLNITFIKSFLTCVSNSYNKDEFMIKGQHNLKFKFVYDEDISSGKVKLNINTYSNVIEFLLASEKNQERLFIFRNALTTYISNDSNLKDLNNQIINILDTTQHNFKLFVEDELKVFLEQKNKLLDEAIKTAKQIVTFTNDLTTNIRTICLTIFSGVILSFIPKINQLIKDNLTGAIIIILGYIAYLIINLIITYKIKEQKNNFMNNFKSYTDYMSVEDNSILSYENLEKEFLSNHDKTFKFLFGLTFILNILFILIALVYICYLNNEAILSMFEKYFTKSL